MGRCDQAKERFSESFRSYGHPYRNVRCSPSLDNKLAFANVLAASPKQIWSDLNAKREMWAKKSRNSQTTFEDRLRGSAEVLLLR
jgi:hypothetical protein